VPPVTQPPLTQPPLTQPQVSRPAAGQEAAQLRALVADLITVKPDLRAEDVSPESSLVNDLGFGSLDLVALASRIHDRYPDFDLRRWIAGAVQSEVDSVGSMAALLAESME
jgi:acyl carrier protein